MTPAAWRYRRIYKDRRGARSRNGGYGKSAAGLRDDAVPERGLLSSPRIRRGQQRTPGSENLK